MLNPAAISVERSSMNKPFSFRFNTRNRGFSIRKARQVRSAPMIETPCRMHFGDTADFKSALRRIVLAATLAVALLPPLAVPQSLWRDDSKSMFADKRGVNVGDIITILVQENTTTSKDNKTATSKQAAVDASIATFLYSPAASGLLTKGGQLPALKYSAKNDFSGGGSINNSEKIIARVAVRVV